MLGARIAALRRSRGMSQGVLAQKLGVSPSAVGMYEQGRREPGAAILIALSECFGVSTDYLLTGKPNRSEAQTLQTLIESRINGETRRPEGFSAQELAVLLAAMLTNP